MLSRLQRFDGTGIDRRNGSSCFKRWLTRSICQTEEWRVLDRAHTTRNNVEYEGVGNVDEQLVAAMLRVTKRVAEAVNKLAML